MATNARDPWYRITPEKLLNDLRLRRLCQENARALYYDGRHLMHAYGEPYGHLALIPGVPMTPAKIGDLLMMATGTVESALQQLFECGLWRRTEDGVAYDPDLIATLEAVNRNREIGRLGGNPKFKRTPGSTTGSTTGSTPGSTPGLTPSSSLSPSPSSSPSEKEREKREREGWTPPTEQQFLDAFPGEDIDEAYLREKWAALQGHNGWLNKDGRPKDFRVLVRGYWKKDKSAWRAQSQTETRDPENRAAIEAQLKIEKNPARRKELLALLEQNAA